MVTSIKNHSIENFKSAYGGIDVLIIDDIQFIGGKDTAQEEFFHTFNAVTSAGGQIIMTSDKPPTEIAGLEERLKSRFEAGLTVDIGAPDFDLRCAITQIKAEQKKLNLDTEQVQLIAANVESARKIEGIVQYLKLPFRFPSSHAHRRLNA